MIKSILFPDRDFSSKEEMFKEIKTNLSTIIDFKKSLIQKSCDKGVAVNCKVINTSHLDEESTKAIQFDPAYYYIAVNTTKVLDSHDDLHINGIWNKSIQEQQGKVYLTVDHELEIDKIVVKKEYIEMFTANLSFASMGFKYQGNTQALIYKFRKDRIIHVKAKEWLESGDPIEASVRMQYVTIEFAMDSNNPEDATEKGRYDMYINSIANKDDFDYIPYFFVIKEAKNVRESALVVAGSNHVTGNVTQQSKKSEPVESTPKIENKIDPTTVSQKLSNSLLLT